MISDFVKPRHLQEELTFSFSLTPASMHRSLLLSGQLLWYRISRSGARQQRRTAGRGRGGRVQPQVRRCQEEILHLGRGLRGRSLRGRRRRRIFQVPTFLTFMGIRSPEPGAYPGGMHRMHRMHVHPPSPPCASPPPPPGHVHPPLPSLKGWL